MTFGLDSEKKTNKQSKHTSTTERERAKITNMISIWIQKIKRDNSKLLEIQKFIHALQ